MASHYPSNEVQMRAVPRRKRRWPRIVLFTAAWIIAIVVVFSVFGVLWLRSAAKAALPILDGDIHLAAQGAPALSAPVTVRRDQHGVPHIDAASQHDMFVAQGYVTAQDRLWQMDVYRRNANGELAEVLGPSLLRHDKAQRMFQFRNTAHRIYANLPPEERARYEAYASGVNLYIAQHQDALPPEFRFLHYKPQPWTGPDSISIGMMMVDMLDTHWYTKLSRERIAAKLNNSKLESDLYPVGSWRDHPPTGELPDLTKPHPPLPTTSDDEDNERSETPALPSPRVASIPASIVAPSVTASSLGNQPSRASIGASSVTASSVRDQRSHASGHDFIRTVKTANKTSALIPSHSLASGHDFSPAVKPANITPALFPGHSLASGHDFSRAVKPAEMIEALQAAEKRLEAGSVTRARLGEPSWVAGRKIADKKSWGFSPCFPECAADAEFAAFSATSLAGWETTTADNPACPDCTPGSNNWVVAGTHTASGKPLLSNDMHLSLTVPNIWYMADLRAPGFHAAGVTLPGMPFVIAGHNEHVAWGFTALYADVQDLYIEEVQGNNYERGDTTWQPLTVDHETIHVRGRKDVDYDVRLTDHGPLLDPMFTKDSRAIALKWTLYDTTLNSIPLFALDTASNWTEFSSALSQWSWPTQNVVYSDDQGHIGYHAVGKVPIRWGGTEVFTSPLPHITMNLRYEWGIPKHDGTKYVGEQVYIPFENMPNAFDPPSGFLATANSNVQKPRNPDGTKNYPFTNDMSTIPLTNDWADPYRAERIYKLLQGRDQLKPSDMLAVQTDIYSEMDQEMGHRLATAIDHAPNTDDPLRKAADLMRNWDGRLTTDSAAASLVTQTRYTLRAMLLQPKLGKEDAEIYQWSESNFAIEEIVMNAKPDWLPPNYKDWDAFLADAVRRAMKDARAPSDAARWNYGSWHVVDLEHPLSTFLPYIGRIARTGPFPLSGDTTTVKQVGRAFGPSQRFTMDWSNIDGSTENIVLGESGNPFSPYFRDQWDDYYNGRTFALPFTPAAVAANTQHTLRLLP